MNRILIIFAHPALEKSRVQYRLLQAAQSVAKVTIHDLYEHYPDFNIDISHEQQLLREHDIILFQHPFYWYSSPALLKEWQDLVLEYGFAYGSTGTELSAKTLITVTSTGGRLGSYRRHGHNHFTIRELLAPFEQTANLCGMTYLPPFVVHGTHNLSGAVIDQYATRYQHLLQRLQTETPPADELKTLHYLNDWQNTKG